MEETRWKRIESLFHEALSFRGEERRRFLVEACQGNDSLFQELSSLLAHYQEEDELLEKGMLDRAGELKSTVPIFQEGQDLGHYQIIRLLGKGGMGEVYLARDLQLRRQVAIKILPRTYALNPGLTERLRREALATSALNHPNILTIHEIGQQGETYYIVSEFVEGVLLRELIGKLPLSRAVDYARQIGQALQTAHEAGIIHRDIKPENIVVRSDGYIKVLDFGLAKLTLPQSVAGESLYQRLANSTAATIPGVLIGTINYMSPEQVRGSAVDARTDIWSWGVVLYEMVTGERPFAAPTPGDVMAAILHREPAPPGKNKHLQRVITKAMSPELENRYSTMRDALADLAGLRFDKKGFRSLPVHWKFLPIAISITVLAILLIVRLSLNQKPPAPWSPIQLTQRGDVTHIAFSPDAKYVVYSTGGRDGQTLRRRFITNYTDELLTKITSGSCSGLSFSRDGKFIYYVVEADHRGTLYRLPVGQPDPKLFLDDDVDSPVSFSPDGEQFVFFRASSGTNLGQIIIRTELSGKETTLWHLNPPDFFYPYPIWSTDGKKILYATYKFSGSNPISIGVIDVETKEARPKPVDVLLNGKPAWLQDGRGFLVAARSPLSSNAQILKFSWPEGSYTNIHEDEFSYGDVDLGPDSVAAIRRQRQASISIIPFNHHTDPYTVPYTKGMYQGLTWPSSATFVSQSENKNQPDLFSIDRNTGDKRPITNDAFLEKDPVSTPDGRYLVYASNRDGIFHLWRLELGRQGSKPERITSSLDWEDQPTVSQDGQWVVFTSLQGTTQTLWKAPLLGGAPPVALSSNPARKAAISPDGRLVVCEYFEAAKHDWSTAILHMDTGEKLKTFDEVISPVSWSPDGKHLLYVRSKDSSGRPIDPNVWSQPVDGGPPEQMTHYQSEQSLRLRFLRTDGQSPVCTVPSSLMLFSCNRQSKSIVKESNQRSKSDEKNKACFPWVIPGRRMLDHAGSRTPPEVGKAVPDRITCKPGIGTGSSI